ncbi:MAG TPA: PrsW family glutamic-type intramembrane protease [Candidatus Paceibacterota bacterium]|uniref:Protease PrsW n=1 Tax=Candidatus Doudnabacteria bacterium RIFCSPHIGHO2_01_52_17 TaxID=1817820 RepID=A0A1F5NA90_9BACT|nr:MAG: hypothetical protein A3K06_02330 [Candidatus Doudnabacteria bacterium RIFCSPHIGHO2_01_52_17]
MAQITPLTIAGVILGGFLPALLWLWFWLKEDPHPEPRRTLVMSFLLGMAAVPVALLLEYVLYRTLAKLGAVRAGEFSNLFLLFGWAFIEEGMKLLTAWWADLKRSVYDEPVDAMIYLITVALGFSALENMLFLTNGLGDGALQNLVTANLRFFGATLLHTVTAGAMGAAIAFSFFHKEHRWKNILGGVILATGLHWAFNALIMKSGPSGLLQTFSAVWALVIVLIFIFEKVKKLRAS